MIEHGKLVGKICPAEALHGTIQASKRLVGTAQITAQEKIAEYTGTYSVCPDVKAQTLETENKKMKKDVTILSIPVYKVSNDKGGCTFVIGGNV